MFDIYKHEVGFIVLAVHGQIWYIHMEACIIYTEIKNLNLTTKSSQEKKVFIDIRDIYLLNF